MAANPMQLNEPVVRALVARMDSSVAVADAKLSAYITAINAEAQTVSDGYAIQNPAKVYPFIPPLGLLTEFPTIGIQSLPGRLEDDTAHAAVHVARELVVVYLTNADHVALSWQIRRYVRALGSCARYSGALEGGGGADDGGAWVVNTVSYDYGPTLGDTDDPKRVPKEYLTWAGVLVEAKRDE